MLITKISSIYLKEAEIKNFTDKNFKYKKNLLLTFTKKEGQVEN